MIKRISLDNLLDYLSIILISFTVNFIYGSIGVLAQDTFAYFDTAFRILQGSTPFKDYWTVSGPFIDFYQAFFFFIFGVSWKSYIIGSSLINVFITIIIFNFFKIYDFSRGLNLFYSICFSILANPSMGSPFPDHFSAFFSLAAITLFLIFVKNKKANILYFIPLLFFISFFSKQTPASYLFVSFLIILLTYFFLYKKLFFVKYFLISSFFCFLLFFLIISAQKINFQAFLDQYIFYPKSIGSERLDNLNFDIMIHLASFKFIYIPLIFILLRLLLIFWKGKIEIEKNKEEILIYMSLLLISFSLIFHQILTMNFIFIFFSIPLLVIFLHKVFKKKNKFNNSIRILLILFTVFTTIKYHYRFNEDRKMLNLEKVKLETAVDSLKIDEKLKGLKWISIKYQKNPLNEIKIINEIIDIVKKDKNRLMFYSDYIFLSALLNKDLNTPTRWPSLKDASNPSKKNEFHEVYLNFVKKIIKQKKIEVIYSTIDKENDIFYLIFNEKCKNSKEISEVLIKHDIKSCIKVK
ncbi:hypothetical protein N9U73_00835 [Candidatus Pelagibacter bacterium]|nr:hypothetical protein [Candidatus Pelagibacter bacterium]